MNVRDILHKVKNDVEDMQVNKGEYASEYKSIGCEINSFELDRDNNVIEPAMEGLITVA